MLKLHYNPLKMHYGWWYRVEFNLNGVFVESVYLIIRVCQNDYDLVDETILEPGEYTKVKPGLYSLKGIRTIRDLVILITSISNDRKRITIYEGSNFRDIAKMLESQLNISSDRFISLCYDKNFIKSLGIDIDIPSLEGFLYPDTYVLLLFFFSGNDPGGI